MKISPYIIVFGAIAAIIVLAALSTYFFNQSQPSANSISLANLTDYGPAPALNGSGGWINSQPLNLSQLRGKVVLIDFWTYSCINCIRSIPYLNAWYAKYKNDGLVIIGVSTPEFLFEHNYTNVANAVQRFGIQYPVMLDNNYSTWTAYDNHYWPADYLIDANGDVRYVQFGEGNYNVTEKAIQVLLENAGYSVPTNLINITSPVNFSLIGSPELYLGYGTARQPIGNQQGFDPDNVVDYGTPNVTQMNTAYFGGSWYNAPDSMISVNGSKIFLIYDAKFVNVVASGNGTVNLTISLDGAPLPANSLGADAKIVNGNAVVQVNSPRLYNIIETPGYGTHELEIDAQPGFRIYTFTFG